MPIPKHQKLAIAAIVLVGAALSGVMLMKGRHAETGEGAKPPSTEAVARATEKPAAGARDDDDRAAPKGPGKPADADDDRKSGGEKAEGKEEKSAEKGHDEVGERHAPKKILLDEKEIKAAGIVVAQAGPGTVDSVLELPGEIQFDQDHTVHVVPRVSGTVERVMVRLGQQVRQGETLAVVASGTVSDQRSDLLTAQKRLGFAEATFAREKKLWEEKISAEQDYLQARQAMEESRLAVANLRQKLAAIGASSAGAALNQFEIRAPIKGAVVEKQIVQGDAVKEDAAVFTISDLRSVWADVAVSPATLALVRVGTKVVVQATGMDARAAGTVSYVGAFLGEQSRTAHARVSLANPAMLWRPGMFATVSVVNGEVPAAVTVQADAVQLVDNVPTVFLATAGGFLAREVKIGRSGTRNVEILEGVRPGDRYAASGSFVLKADLGKSSVQSDD